MKRNREADAAVVPSAKLLEQTSYFIRTIIDTDVDFLKITRIADCWSCVLVSGHGDYVSNAFLFSTKSARTSFYGRPRYGAIDNYFRSDNNRAFINEVEAGLVYLATILAEKSKNGVIPDDVANQVWDLGDIIPLMKTIMDLEAKHAVQIREFEKRIEEMRTHK